MTPDTRYARSADVNIAYQVVGAALRDLVLVPRKVSSQDLPGAWRLFAREPEGW